MKLACTKKLLDYLGMKAEKIQDEVDPLFGWTANLLVINRRKTLVVAHTASRCGFVLHGLKAKDLPKLPQLIFDGIQNLLETEYVRPAVIEQYLNDLGREVSFFANSSRKAVAACNKVCERLKMVSEWLDAGDLLQPEILPWLNDEVLLNTGFTYAYEGLLGMLESRYGEGIVSCRALELEVELELNTPCKRRIVVPENINFFQFHKILQNCFAWRDEHLHRFIIETDAVGRISKTIEPVWDDRMPLPGVEVLDSEQVKVREIFPAREKIIYEYDFGDDWVHTIRLCRIIEDCTEPYPRCIMAVGDPPMENCGGPDGYAYIMEVLQNKSHPEYRDIAQWVGDLSRYTLDVDWINSFIKDGHRRLNFYF